ncbi:MAG: alanine--tRNA ligase [Bacteroidia bacterium]
MALSSSEIRAKYLEFFAQKGHKIVPSAPIVVKGDPTLMFTNAGMNQFKDYFLGNAQASQKRIADTQKCLRVSGKHNDLDEVGHDHYHHTMFEMLGNWSFGDYFKEEAIDWAWELLTSVYGLPKDQLYVTVFEGDPESNVAFDQAAYDRWMRWVPASRIINGNKKDNFWEMGDTGPCGPCTEIHFDMRSASERAQMDGSSLVNKDHPEVIEIWNLVFMEFNRQSDGSLVKLPEQHVDTGMGFERLTRAIQGKSSNYDTDIFQYLIEKTAQLSGHAYGDAEAQDIAFRVIADHIRAVALCIADGQLPSNAGAGYVVRRILRRAVRYGYSYLGLQQPFLCELVPDLASFFASAFPELNQQASFVSKVVKEEELSFFRTLATGMSRIQLFLQQNPGQSVDGQMAFELYDTFGFPYDLTELIARENGIQVDRAGFEKALNEQKERSRADAAKATGDWMVCLPQSSESFVGYDHEQVTTRISRYRSVEQKGKTQVHIVLDETPFYAESGGQVGDSGYLVGCEDGQRIRVLDTQKENKLHLLVCEDLPNRLDQVFAAEVDSARRFRISCNHSATHLLHSALREVLGEHVAQKGSLVNDKQLRFDFSHFAKMSEEELQQVEQRVNEQIQAAIALEEMRNLPIEEAKALGATALFGEKYGDQVRVIAFDRAYSIELCGGTHIRNTRDIQLFKLKAESSVAAGVRRVEAITQEAAMDMINQRLSLLAQLEAAMGHPADALATWNKTQEELSKSKKQLEQLEGQQLQHTKSQLLQQVETIQGIPTVVAQLNLPSADAAKQLCFQLKQELGNPVVLIAFEASEKPGLAFYIDDQWVAEKGWNASQWVRECGKEIQGGGGGQPFFATAGGKWLPGLDEALKKAKSMLG